MEESVCSNKVRLLVAGERWSTAWICIGLYRLGKQFVPKTDAIEKIRNADEQKTKKF